MVDSISLECKECKDPGEVAVEDPRAGRGLSVSRLRAHGGKRKDIGEDAGVGGCAARLHRVDVVSGWRSLEVRGIVSQLLGSCVGGKAVR